MRSKRLNSAPVTYAVIFDKGDEVVQGLANFANDKKLSAAGFTGLGAFSDVVLGFFDLENKDYRRNRIGEQVEVVALVGDITLGKTGRPTVHPHVVVAKADGTAYGGHLMEAHVQPTLEVIVTESPSYLRRRLDDATGLALVDLDADLQPHTGKGSP